MREEVGRMILRSLLLWVLCAMSGCASPSGGWPLEVHLLEVPGAQKSLDADGSIVVATYNVHGLIDPQSLSQDFVALPVDIWLLQEVRWDDSSGNALRPILAPGKWFLAVLEVNPADDGKAGNEAQVIASRFPIRRAEVWPFAGASQRRRCALAVWVGVADRSLQVVNTDHEPDFLSINSAHDRQMRELTARMSQTEQAPNVVGGDFNTCGSFWRFRSSAEDAKLAHETWRSVGFSPAVELPSNTFKAGPVELSLDHLFIRGVRRIESGVLRSAAASDHRPVWCRMSFTSS